MILVASKDSALADKWHQALSAFYQVYDINALDWRALELDLKKVSFDAVLVDLALLGDSGVNEISTMLDIQPTINIIIMTKAYDQREEISAILFGAKAYCLHEIKLELLPKVVKTVLDKELWVDRKFVTRLLCEIEDITRAKHDEAKHLDKGVATMTPREGEIATLIATGASNRKIAERLNISERTVKAHLGVIFRKLNITDRLQLALYMNRHQQLASVWHGAKMRSERNQ